MHRDHEPKGGVGFRASVLDCPPSAVLLRRTGGSSLPLWIASESARGLAHSKTWRTFHAPIALPWVNSDTHWGHELCVQRTLTRPADTLSHRMGHRMGEGGGVNEAFRRHPFR